MNEKYKYWKSTDYGLVEVTKQEYVIAQIQFEHFLLFGDVKDPANNDQNSPAKRIDHDVYIR